MNNSRRVVFSLVLSLMLAVTVFMSLGNESYAAHINYDAVYNTDYYMAANPDLVLVFGTDSKALLNHFVKYGMAEGRQACAEFNVHVYRATYPDLAAAYGDDLKQYYMHYINYGKAEGRTAYYDGNGNSGAQVVQPITQPETVYFENTGITVRHIQTTPNGNFIYSRHSQEELQSDIDANNPYIYENNYWSEYILQAIDAAGVRPSDSDYVKATKITEYVCTHCTYDLTNQHTADWYGPIGEGRAKCAGYASCVADMCRACGVESYCITNWSINHGWNFFIIDHKTYYADSCWGINKEYDYTNGTRHCRELQDYYAFTEDYSHGPYTEWESHGEWEYMYSTIGVKGAINIY